MSEITKETIEEVVEVDESRENCKACKMGICVIHKILPNEEEK